MHDNQGENIEKIFDDLYRRVRTNDDALIMLNRFFGALLLDSLTVETKSTQSLSLDYLKCIYYFKRSYARQDYIECCRQIEELFCLHKITDGLKKNMLYLFYETLGKDTQKMVILELQDVEYVDG